MFKKYRWNYKTVNANYFCFIFLSGALNWVAAFFVSRPPKQGRQW